MVIDRTVSDVGKELATQICIQILTDKRIEKLSMDEFIIQLSVIASSTLATQSHFLSSREIDEIKQDFILQFIENFQRFTIDFREKGLERL